MYVLLKKVLLKMLRFKKSGELWADLLDTEDVYIGSILSRGSVHFLDTGKDVIRVYNGDYGLKL